MEWRLVAVGVMPSDMGRALGLDMGLDPDMGLDRGLDLDTDLDLDKPQWMWGDTHGRGGDPSWLCADQCAWAPHYVLGVAPWPC